MRAINLTFLNKIEELKPFTEPEAWFIFRVAAIAEAVGWTLLIIGVGINRYHLPGQNIMVQITGQIHGTIFFIYFGVLLVVYSSLLWSRKRFLIAVVAGVPPYGTLIFEQWASKARKYQLAKQYFCSILLSVVRD